MTHKDTTEHSEAFPFEGHPAVEKGRLIIEGLRQNNLKNLNITIPHDRVTAVVGPSGSGKSSLAFDTLFAEGRWRFVESLSTYTRLFLDRMDRPELDAIKNIRPAIAVEQKNPIRTNRATVGTSTEINDYLRLLFSRIGVAHCPICAVPVAPSGPERAAEALTKDYTGRSALIGFDMPAKGKTPEELAATLLKKGFFRTLEDGQTVNITEDTPASSRQQALRVIADRLVIEEGNRKRLVESLETAFREGGGDAWVYLDGKTELRFSSLPKCRSCGATAQRPTPMSLSFNHPVGACPVCKGFGNILKYDADKIIPDKDKTLDEGAIEPWTKPAYAWWYWEMKRHAKKSGIALDKPFSKLPAKTKRLIFEGAPSAAFRRQNYGCQQTFAAKSGAGLKRKVALGINDFFAYLDTKKYKLHVKVFTSRYKTPSVCPECNGGRLRKSARDVLVAGLDITQVSAMTIKDAFKFFESLEIAPFEREAAKELTKQLLLKLEFLNQTGLGYITLDRLSKTLSGGEAQRVQLATQLASSLCGVLYILDEPSIGLHPVDVGLLIRQIRRLSSLGNTVVVVEHDHEVIKNSDYIIELGPGAGERGGRLVYGGETAEFLKNAKTLTADYISGRQVIHTPIWRRKGAGERLTLSGATGNNLKDVEISIPLRAMTCISGVSGSGKSSLIIGTLYNALAARFKTGAKENPRQRHAPLPYRAISGFSHVNGVKLIDQSPVGRTPRSIPLSYIGGLDEIRSIFASLPSARSAGLKAGHFSFNVPGGRCESCKGEGVETLEMYFLPDVFIRCAACNGRRFKPGVLSVKYRGRNIYDCLEMTFDEAGRVFTGNAVLQKKISTIKEVGLGYLKLGQPAVTLSGGEAQRLKIARELGAGDSESFVYILDEPTTGLHTDDAKKLLTMLGRLVDAGNTVVMIEHNLDCLKTADFIIDLGPGGGGAGGRIVASGPPERVATVKESLTGRFLKKLLD
ncbi:MAG: excinuclease ABC subunit UvrA [Deltaproteobacteria bacterium]|nr:excinuclease ABC subunit UvrA [Deltaproteobacteria bacterium]